MRRCKFCGKWYFGNSEICPKCGGDQSEDPADEEKYADLLEEAEELAREGETEKSGEKAAEAAEEILRLREDVPYPRIEQAVELLSNLYVEEESGISEELMADLMDYLEERAEERKDGKKDISRLKKLRERISEDTGEDLSGSIERPHLPFQEDFWELPEPEEVLSADTEEFEADLTKTVGLSMMETGCLFYRNFLSAFAALENPEKTEEDFIKAVLAGSGLKKQDAGFAVSLFYAFLSNTEEEGRNALKALYSKKAGEGTAETVKRLLTQTAAEAGLYPESLFVLSLFCPLLGSEGADRKQIYLLAEPGMRELIGVIRKAREKLRGKSSEEKQYGMQLIQTMCTEYANFFAVCEYEEALRQKVKGPLYRKLLEDAAGNGLASACAQAAGHWFCGDCGYEIRMDYAKYYTVILKLRKLEFPIVKTLDAMTDVKVKVPGIDD